MLQSGRRVTDATPHHHQFAAYRGRTEQRYLMRVPVRRSHRSALALAAVATVLLASACTSADDSSDGPEVDLGALGEPQKATGSPVKVGYISDGGLSGATSDPVADLARATFKYLNEYKNGLNGHVIELVDCETGNVPSGATACGAQMIEDGVVAALSAASTQEVAVFAALQGSGVPYVQNRSAIPDVVNDPNAFILTNPLDAFDSITAVALAEGIDTVGIPIIDVPAATGPVLELVKPRLDAAGLGLVYTPVAPSVADMTPQIVQMIDEGAGMIVPVGTNAFTASALKAIKQNGFDGPVQIGIPVIPDDFVAAVPGGLEGITNIIQATGDPEDPDVKLFYAIGSEYDVDGFEEAAPTGFQVVATFARMLEGLEGDVTAESVSDYLANMSEPVLRVMGGGIEIQCGADLIPEQPAVCTTQGLTAALDKDGKATAWELFG